MLENSGGLRMFRGRGEKTKRALAHRKGLLQCLMTQLFQTASLKKTKQNRVQIGSSNCEAFLTFHTAGQSLREGGVNVTLLITESINAEAEGFQSYLT